MRDRSRDAFLDRGGGVFVRARPAGIYPKPAARAVFRVLANRISAGEIDEVRNALPKHIRDLWD